MLSLLIPDMKLLIMIDSLTCGGAEKSLVSLLPYLCSRGYDITLMLRARGGLFEPLVPTAVRTTDFPASQPAWWRRALFSACLRLPATRHIHSAELHWQCIGHTLPPLDENYDVAIAYQQGFPTFFIADKVKAHRKICWANVDLAGAGYSATFCRPFYDKYHTIVAVSPSLATKLAADTFTSPGARVKVCRDILNPTLIRSMAAECHPFPKDGRIHLTTVGRLTHQKGYDLAIRAAAILRDRAMDFSWHIVGDGPLRQQLEAHISSLGLDGHVVLEGVHANPYPYMAGCDIYVQTSRFEGFGLTIGEAKILGRPIVSTDFTVVTDQITDGHNGLICPMEPGAIADSIMRLTTDLTLRRHITSSLSLEHNTTHLTEAEKVIRLIEE